MKKIFLYLGLSTIFLIFLTLTILSTVGIETNKFNNLIYNKINQSNNDIKLDLNKIKFKVDIKKIGLFLETKKPKVNYRETTLPVNSVKVYIDFFPLIKSDIKIKKINLILDKINIKDLKKISKAFKPSNIKSFLNNKIDEGKLDTEIDIFFNDDNLLDNFIAKGFVSDLKVRINKNIILKNTSFSFFADDNDILLKNIFSQSEIFKIKNGDLKVSLSPDLILESNFETNLKYNNKLKKYLNLIKNLKYSNNLNVLDADFQNNFKIILDNTYKVKEYSLKSRGKILNAEFKFKEPLENSFLIKKIENFKIKDSAFTLNLSLNNITTDIIGKYSLNNENFLSFNFNTKSINDLVKFDINLEYDKEIQLHSINYTKPEGKIAKLNLTFEKNKDNLNFKEISFSESENSIVIEDLKLRKQQFESLKNITVKTRLDKKFNNDFIIKFGKKISINGSHFDATNFLKSLNDSSDQKTFSKINKEIEIDFKNIFFPFSENLTNFKLIGKIKKGKFINISSKGDFGNNNFLDISMKLDKKSNKKYLEIYSDLTRPLLTEYNFFKGLMGGKLFFSSIIQDNYSNSKLTIENFKVVNAPGMVKLLSLADLGGLADLAEGEGISFDILEIEMEKTKNNLKLNEILALGPSISVLMQGYQNPEITSLRGTLVPAKTLNKLISKIPLIGDIIIPKEVGEGLFGISFKIKGSPGKLKTSVNPIRTITPRFIQKIIDKNKEIK